MWQFGCAGIAIDKIVLPHVSSDTCRDTSRPCGHVAVLVLPAAGLARPHFRRTLVDDTSRP
eukprot:7339000-Karenia_brevis.AAC.1